MGEISGSLSLIISHLSPRCTMWTGRASTQQLNCGSRPIAFCCYGSWRHALGIWAAHLSHASVEFSVRQIHRPIDNPVQNQGIVPDAVEHQPPAKAVNPPRANTRMLEVLPLPSDERMLLQELYRIQQRYPPRLSDFSSCALQQVQFSTGTL